MICLGLLADEVGEQQDRHDQGDDDEHDDDRRSCSRLAQPVVESLSRDVQLRSDRLAEVADGLQVGVHRRQHGGHVLVLSATTCDAAEQRAERPVHGHEVADHPHQAERGGGDDQADDARW